MTNPAETLFTLHKELEQLLGSVAAVNVALLNATYPEFMPVQLAGKYLGLSASHLNKLRSMGGGPPFCDFGPKAVRYRRADLDGWAEAHKRAHTAEKQAKSPAYALARERRKNRRNVLIEQPEKST